MRAFLIAAAAAAAAACTDMERMQSAYYMMEIITCSALVDELQFNSIYIGTIDGGPLKRCVRKHAGSGAEAVQSACLDQVRGLAGREEDNVVGSLAAMVASEEEDGPDLACPCILDSSASLGDCVPAVSALGSYCRAVGHEAHGGGGGGLTVCDDDIARLTCPTGSFEDVIGCLQEHVFDLRADCAALVAASMQEVLLDCAIDVVRFCPSADSEVGILGCLASHDDELSARCADSMERHAEAAVPCATEANDMCGDEEELELILDCLTDREEDVSDSCRALLELWYACDEEDFDWDGRRRRLARGGEDKHDWDEDGIDLPSCLAFEGEGEDAEEEDDGDEAEDEGARRTRAVLVAAVAVGMAVAAGITLAARRGALAGGGAVPPRNPTSAGYSRAAQGDDGASGAESAATQLLERPSGYAPPGRSDGD